MEALDKIYITELQNLSGSIQNSDLLAQFLDEEEPDMYKALVDEFEPKIHELYLKVANNNPLQIETFEKELLNPAFEGLYLPKVLGYSVLRGEVNDNFKYAKPQNHFKDVLNAICNSANFELISQRTGQTIKIGFLLSSDIWVTNFLDGVTNKRVYQFLQGLRDHKYRVAKNREVDYKKYLMQFSKLNFQSADFPTSKIELKTKSNALKDFLLHRASKDFNNSTLMGYITDFLNNSDLYSEDEYLELLIIIGMLFDLSDEARKSYSKAFDQVRKSNPNVQNDFFTLLEGLHDDPNILMLPEYDSNLSKLINKKDDDVSQYFGLMDVIHGKGYIHQDAIDATQVYVDNHDGLSSQNECVRHTVHAYFKKFLSNLDEGSYADYFEINKTFVLYMNIFYNQRFNQAVKAISMKYVKRLLKTYTDKRGKDYQDIKKYISTHFLDMGFLKEKEIKELFKTKRKKAS